MKTFIVLMSISAFAVGAEFSIGSLIEPIVPTRAYTTQCKDVCRCSALSVEDCQYSEVKCHPDLSNTWINCCDWCRTR